MLLSRRQKAVIHQAAQAVGYDDARRKIVQWTVGGFHSCADEVTREGFIRVMAFFEAECRGQLPGYTPGYWRGEDRRSGPGTSLAFACRREATEMGWTEAELDAFLASPKMSNGKFLRVSAAPAYWLSRLLDGLKAIKKRQRAEAEWICGHVPEHGDAEVPF
jgi:hypothetical protein